MVIDYANLAVLTARTPSLGWAGSLMSEVNGQCGTALRYAVSNVLEEFGLDKVQTFLETNKTRFSLPYHSKGAVALTEKSYMPGDRYLMSDDVRKTTDLAFRKANKEVVWIESAGVLDLGNEATNAAGSAKISATCRYRRLEPYETPSGIIDAGVSWYHSLELPTQALQAQKMPTGAEFEIIGEGKARIQPGIGSELSFSSGLGGANVKASVGVLYDLQGEISIMVQKLPLPNQVLVRLSTSHGSSKSLQAQVDSNASIIGTSFTRYAPKWLMSTIRYILNSGGFAGIQRLSNYLKTTLIADSSSKQSHKELSRFVFDLSKSECQQAYNEIFTRLSTFTATKLAKIPNSGVRADGSAESENSSSAKGLVQCATGDVLSYHSISENLEGEILQAQERKVAYRECKFAKATSNWFSGNKSILWESVSVAPAINEAQRSYYHLNFRKQQKVVEDQAVDEFLSFCSALGIGASSQSIAGLARVFSGRDDIDSDVDIYFTDQGVKNLNKCTFEEALKAHLDTQGHFNVSVKGIPKKSSSEVFKMVSRYAEFNNSWFFMKWFYQKDMKHLQEEYRLKTKRDIIQDSHSITQAKIFAQKMVAMDQNSSDKSVRDFFAFLGKRSGFDFMKTIATMVKIAGQNETLIHQVSMTGGSMSLAAVDEGEILHPQREAMRTLVNLA